MWVYYMQIISTYGVIAKDTIARKILDYNLNMLIGFFFRFCNKHIACHYNLAKWNEIDF